MGLGCLESIAVSTTTTDWLARSSSFPSHVRCTYFLWKIIASFASSYLFYILFLPTISSPCSLGSVKQIIYCYIILLWLLWLVYGLLYCHNVCRLVFSSNVFSNIEVLCLISSIFILMCHGGWWAGSLLKFSHLPGAFFWLSIHFMPNQDQPVGLRWPFSVYFSPLWSSWLVQT
jgi:hypothetical protein